MRAFIAIELPEDIRKALAQLQDKLKSCGADVKWVEPNNIHLTLKFLGEIDEAQLNKITSIMQNVSATVYPFPATISAIGAFPRINSPRVIWIGIDKGDNEIKTIAKLLENEIKNVGIPAEDKPFSSHITIARTKSSFNLEKLVKELKTIENDFGLRGREFKVTKITLFKSSLTPKGPIYEILKEADLKTI